MNRWVRVGVAILLSAGLCPGQQPRRKPPRGNALVPPARAMEAAAEPHHQLVYEDEHVRVLLVELEPGDATRRHRHDQGFLIIALDDADFSISGSVTPERTQLGPGQMQVGKGGVEQQEKNEAAQPFRSLSIELKHGLGEEDILCGLDRPACRGALVGGEVKVGTYSVSPLFETRTLKVAETTLDPGVTLARDIHGAGHLRVALTESEMEESVDGAPATHGLLRPGQVIRVEQGRRWLTNRSRETARYLTIECKHL